MLPGVVAVQLGPAPKELSASKLLSSSPAEIFLAGIHVILTCASRTHPRIDLRKFEFPKPPYPMCRKAFGFDPTVNGILGYTKVICDFFDRNPSFWHGASLHGRRAHAVAK